MVYVSYHIFEHYSSVRNLAGPHKGLPRIKEVRFRAPALPIETGPTDITRLVHVVDYPAYRRFCTARRIVHRRPCG